MSLPSLLWKKLPPVTLSVTSSTSTFLRIVRNMMTGSVYFDGSARTIATGSAWSSSISYVTGSNVEAVLCYPPRNGRTALSQSVLFVGRNTIGARSSVTPTMTSGEDAYTNGYISMGLSKNSGNLVNWWDAKPMGTNSFFTGYTNLRSNNINTATTAKITMYESKEALILVYGPGNLPATINYCVMAGALFDPEQTVTSVDAESDHRLYGIIRADNASGTGIETTFYAGNTFFLGYSTSNSAKTICFSPQTGTLLPLQCLKFLLSNQISALTTISNKLIKTPLLFSRHDGTYSFIGTLRNIYAVRDFSSNLVIRDGSSNIIGFTISRSDTTANDAILVSYTQ